MQKFIASLNIPEKGYYDDSGSYVIEFDDEKGFNRAYSKLEKNDELTEISDRTSLTLLGINITYEKDNYIIQLKGDLENNTYKMIVTEER